MQKEPLILTLGLDAVSQDFFNARRKLYFPVERNFLAAHLTLFHQLPPEAETFNYFSTFQFDAFEMQVTGLIKLGNGVAYRLESKAIRQLQQDLKQHFLSVLIPQDLQPFRAHITIQNKVSPQEANVLFDKLQSDFTPFSVKATSLQLWTYLAGPWRHEQSIPLTRSTG